jgi:hypothetical protein
MLFYKGHQLRPKPRRLEGLLGKDYIIDHEAISKGSRLITCNDIVLKLFNVVNSDDQFYDMLVCFLNRLEPCGRGEKTHDSERVFDLLWIYSYTLNIEATGRIIHLPGCGHYVGGHPNVR